VTASVFSIHLGQIWRSNGSAETWVVTRVYGEAFNSYVVLRKLDAKSPEVCRIKVDRCAGGVTLPGFSPVH